MSFFEIILFGIATNIDNFAVGMSCGADGYPIDTAANLIIAAVSGAAAYIFCRLSFVGEWPGGAAGIAGALLLVALGAWSLIPPRKGEVTPRRTKLPALAAALALNCAPSALGAGLTGMKAWAAALSAATFSAVSVRAGCLAGRKLTHKKSGSVCRYVSAGAMILLGLLSLLSQCKV